MEQRITAYFPESRVANDLRFRSDSIGICRALLGRGVRTEIAARSKEPLKIACNPSANTSAEPLPHAGKAVFPAGFAALSGLP